MARYNGLIIPRSYNDYFSRSDPQAIRDIVSLAADGELNAESKNPLQNQAIAKIVPATASPDNKLIVQSQISGLTADVETIKNIIPNTASETNVLADKNFVNSTVGTNTANYIYKTESGGEKVPFSSVAELETYAGTVTNNDYAFVTGTDENGNAYYDRYKADVNDGVVTWAKEYRLNNSSFTAEQWAAIQSGITAEKVAQFEGAVSPVDVVQSGNMSAVTSNAVNVALASYPEIISNDNGIAYKFPSGVLICTKHITTDPTWVSWGVLYETNDINLGEWPYYFTPIETPRVQASVVGTYGGFTSTVKGVTNDKAGVTTIVRPNTVSATMYIDIIGIGRWK